MNHPGFQSLLLFVSAFFFTFSANPSVFAQTKVESTEAHYIFPDFQKAVIKLKSRKVESMVLNYNMITEEMVYEKKGIMMALDKLEVIDTVIFEKQKFIPHEKVFFEVIVNGPVSLFLQHKRNLISTGSAVGYGGTSETSATTSVNSFTTSQAVYQLSLSHDYKITNSSIAWIRRNNSFYKVLNERQILKIFPEKEVELKQFIKLNKLDVKKTDDLLLFVKHCNEQEKAGIH
jgi:hypothetical protein